MVFWILMHYFYGCFEITFNLFCTFFTLSNGKHFLQENTQIRREKSTNCSVYFLCFHTSHTEKYWSDGVSVIATISMFWGIQLFWRNLSLLAHCIVLLIFFVTISFFPPFSSNWKLIFFLSRMVISVLFS